jgi:acetamidase/formamidase
MITWLGEEHGLAAEDAFILCSLAGKLKILEVVDAGMWKVAMCLPLGIFHEAAAAV